MGGLGGFLLGFFFNWSMMPISFLHLYIIGDSERPENAKSEFEEYYSLELSMCLSMLLLITFCFFADHRGAKEEKLVW